MQVNFFSTFQDEIPVFVRAGIVYKFKCCDCSTTEHGKTKRHFKVNICEHFGVSSLPGKKVKKDVIYFAVICLVLTVSLYWSVTTVSFTH